MRMPWPSAAQWPAHRVRRAVALLASPLQPGHVFWSRLGRASPRHATRGSPAQPPFCPRLLPHAGILYDFFPAALRAALPAGADPAAGLSESAARAVAAAALAVATLMNAPPGFLEFLLCVPWADLGALYQQAEREEDGAAPAVPQVRPAPPAGSRRGGCRAGLAGRCSARGTVAPCACAGGSGKAVQSSACRAARPWRHCGAPARSCRRHRDRAPAAACAAALQVARPLCARLTARCQPLRCMPACSALLGPQRGLPCWDHSVLCLAGTKRPLPRLVPPPRSS